MQGDHQGELAEVAAASDELEGGGRARLGEREGETRGEEQDHEHAAVAPVAPELPEPRHEPPHALRSRWLRSQWLRSQWLRNRWHS